MQLLNKLLQNLFLYFVIAFAENSARMRNEAVVLSSVYDAMRNNYVDDATVNSGGGVQYYRNIRMPNYEESRNKRNINERWEVDPHDDQSYLPAPSSSVHQVQFQKSDGFIDTGEDQVASGNELICSVYNGGKHNTHSERGENPFLDPHNWAVFGGVGYFLGKAVKFVLSGLALVSLPLIFLMAVGIPLKILLGLKAMTVTNSVVLGSLVYRILNRFLNRTQTTTQATPVDNNIDTTGMTQLRDELLDHHGGPTNEDYPEYNEEQLQKIIEIIRKKNKDW